MPYPHVTQFETLDLRRRTMGARPQTVRVVAPTRARLRSWRAARRRRTADCATCA